MLTIKIDKTDLMLNRSGKANKGDLMVRRGAGIHTPTAYKTKTKQKSKNELKKYY